MRGHLTTAELQRAEFRFVAWCACNNKYLLDCSFCKDGAYTLLLHGNIQFDLPDRQAGPEEMSARKSENPQSTCVTSPASQEQCFQPSSSFMIVGYMDCGIVGMD
jgi:hypothetical protein